MSEWFPDHSRRIDLLLVISEIVTNAVRHGPGQGSIGMEVVSRAPVRLVVHHPGRERIAGRMPDDDSIRQGLMIVDRLSDRWGIELSEDRIGVWFELG